MTSNSEQQQQQEEDEASWRPVRIRTVDPRAVEYESADPGHFLGCRVAYFSFRARHAPTGMPCYVDREFYRHRDDDDDPGELSPEGLAVLRRVEREASVLRALASCDRIRRMVDAFRDDCWIWRVYESSASREERWHDARDLRRIVPRGSASIAGEVRSAMRQLLSALGHCHSRGIVHGRVRPASVLLIARTTRAARENGDGGGRSEEEEGGGGRFDVKLCNFESAHRFGDGERYPPNRHFPASPRYDYDAPELLLLAEGGVETTARTPSPTSSSSLLSQSSSNEFTTTNNNNNKYESDNANAAAEAAAAAATTTAESDMWAAGATFFELVANRPLFPGMSQIDTLFRMFHQLGTPYDGGDPRPDYVGPSNRWPGVSDLPRYYDPDVFPDWRRRGPLPWPEEVRRMLDADGLALLSDLVRLNPRRRIAARDASRHSYFSAPRTQK